MSDETNTNTPNTPGETNPPANPPQSKTYSEAEWNRMAADYRKTQDALKKLQDAEDERKKAEMTEFDRIKAEAEEAKAKAAKLERENLVTKLASTKGLPAELWNRVHGSTPEEIEADVTALLGFVKPSAPQPATTGQVQTQAAPPAPKSPKAEWMDLKAKDPMAAAKFYAKNRDAILSE